MSPPKNNIDDIQSTELLFRGIKLLIQFCLLLLILIISFLIYEGFGAEFRKHQNDYVLSAEEIKKKLEDSERTQNLVVDGIHVATGLVYTEDFELIRGTCTSCHSAKLITQNRATKEGWVEMIRWMQKTQGLWELGSNEDIIVNYLAEYYAPQDIGRRANLDIDSIEWYLLEM